MQAAGVPTAQVLPQPAAPCVLKADGLAAGKGVVVCLTQEEVTAGLVELSGLPGPLVVEELLEGPEVSLFAVCDGVTAIALPVAQDFKRAYDGSPARTRVESAVRPGTRVSMPWTSRSWSTSPAGRCSPSSRHGARRSSARSSPGYADRRRPQVLDTSAASAIPRRGRYCRSSTTICSSSSPPPRRVIFGVRLGPAARSGRHRRARRAATIPPRATRARRSRSPTPRQPARSCPPGTALSPRPRHERRPHPRRDCIGADLVAARHSSYAAADGHSSGARRRGRRAGATAVARCRRRRRHI